MVDLIIVEAATHVQCVLIIVVDHTFIMGFTRLSQLILIVSTVTTSIDDLFLMLIGGVGSICLRHNNALHEIVVLRYHTTLI